MKKRESCNHIDRGLEGVAGFSQNRGIDDATRAILFYIRLKKLHADVFGADIARQKRASNPVCFWLVSEPHELTTQSHVGDSRKSGFR